MAKGATSLTFLWYLGITSRFWQRNRENRQEVTDSKCSEEQQMEKTPFSLLAVWPGIFLSTSDIDKIKLMSVSLKYRLILTFVQKLWQSHWQRLEWHPLHPCSMILYSSCISAFTVTGVSPYFCYFSSIKFRHYQQNYRNKTITWLSKHLHYCCYYATGISYCYLAGQPL